MISRRSLISSAIALAATGLILPEKKLWRLDQTMLTPQFTLQPSVIEDLENLITRRKWVLIYRGLGQTMGPFEEVTGYRPDVPGSEFLIRYDVAARNALHQEALLQEVLLEIKNREDMFAFMAPVDPRWP
jgi:hypothetical protein